MNKHTIEKPNRRHIDVADTCSIVLDCMYSDATLYRSYVTRLMRLLHAQMRPRKSKVADADIWSHLHDLSNGVVRNFR